MQVVGDCAAKGGVTGLVVMTAGFAETGEEGAQRQRHLVALARGAGMRVVGPSSFGLLNTDPDVSLNASLVTDAAGPRNGWASSRSRARSGSPFSTTSARRGLGISSFVSRGQPGRRERQRPDAVLGGRRRDRRRDALPRVDRQPAQVQPHRPAAVPQQAGRRREVRRASAAPPRTVTWSASPTRPPLPSTRCSRGPASSASTRSTRCSTSARSSPTSRCPGADGWRIVGNSDALAVLAADACEEAGLRSPRGHARRWMRTPVGGVRRRPATVFADPEVDSVVALVHPAARTRDAEVAEVLARGRRTRQARGLHVPRHARRPRVPAGR